MTDAGELSPEIIKAIRASEDRMATRVDAGISSVKLEAEEFADENYSNEQEGFFEETAFFESIPMGWRGYIFVGNNRYYDSEIDGWGALGTAITDNSSGEKIKLVIHAGFPTAVTYETFTGFWSSEPQNELWFYIPDGVPTHPVVRW